MSSSGAADGSIIATIITTHIVNIIPKSAAVQPSRLGAIISSMPAIETR